MFVSPRHKAVAFGLLLLAVLFLAVSAVHAHKVYDKEDNGFAGFGLATFTPLSERQLVVDATFSGVTRKGGKLYSTYDRLQARGKKACPT